MVGRILLALPEASIGFSSTRTWSHHNSTPALPYHPKLWTQIPWSEETKDSMLDSWLGILTLVHLYIVDLSFHLISGSPNHLPTSHLLYTSRLACRFGFVQGMKAMNAIFMHWPQLKVNRGYGTLGAAPELRGPTWWVRNTCCSFVFSISRSAAPKCRSTTWIAIFLQLIHLRHGSLHDKPKLCTVKGRSLETTIDFHFSRIWVPFNKTQSDSHSWLHSLPQFHSQISFV